MKVDQRLAGWWHKKLCRPTTQQNNNIMGDDYFQNPKSLGVFIRAHSKWRNIHSRKPAKFQT